MSRKYESTGDYGQKFAELLAYDSPARPKLGRDTNRRRPRKRAGHKIKPANFNTTAIDELVGNSSKRRRRRQEGAISLSSVGEQKARKQFAREITAGLVAQSQDEIDKRGEWRDRRRSGSYVDLRSERCGRAADRQDRFNPAPPIWTKGLVEAAGRRSSRGRGQRSLKTWRLSTPFRRWRSKRCCARGRTGRQA